ncbi:hypothetical protein GK047_13160 [Paenibacillus sp. SYP-B3998]|uniref:ABC transporter permease n=1 Tax=Paenibacillus sp. SYP-B3998 TaxID=2678564 RepID=A0A6G3ZXK9_9BACL|nr:hypothetical protein [Paenibacillus sp. SYP-B3998]NEW06953.1 hypothetical protein [Paenibacillus sp. SYP-B3998]
MISKKVLLDAWWLTRKDFGNNRLMLIWNILFNLYVVFTLLSMTSMGQRSDLSYNVTIFNDVSLNFFVMGIVPIWGFPLSKAFLNYKKTDVYTKRIAYLKTMPISNQVIICSRFLQIIIMVFAMAIVVFVPYFSILSHIGQMPLNLLECLFYAFVWIGYSLTVGCLYICWELGVKGKTYFIRCLLMMPFIVLGAFLLWWLFGQSVWIGMMEWVQQFQVLLPIVSLALGTLAIIASAVWLNKRFAQRDLHG